MELDPDMARTLLDQKQAVRTLLLKFLPGLPNMTAVA